MYNEWSLDIFYKGIDDPALEADVKKLEENVALYKKTIAALTPDDPAKTLRGIIDIKETTTVLVRKIAGYCSLRRSANSKDGEVSALITRIQMLLAGTAKENVAFEKYVGSIEDLDEVLDSDEVLSQYKFYFGEVKASVSHNLSDEAEDVFARLNISGGRAWGDLFSYLTATVEVDYKGEITIPTSVGKLSKLGTVDMNIKGTFTSPKVSIDMASLAKKAAAGVAEQALNKLFGGSSKEEATEEGSDSTATAKPTTKEEITNKLINGALDLFKKKK